MKRITVNLINDDVEHNFDNIITKNHVRMNYETKFDFDNEQNCCNTFWRKEIFRKKKHIWLKWLEK